MLLSATSAASCRNPEQHADKQLAEATATPPAETPGPTLRDHSEPPEPPRDWRCPDLGETKRGGFIGDEKVVLAKGEHAGIRSLALLADADNALVLALLAEADIDNEQGLTTREVSPARSVHVFRLLNESWHDLGRPFQLMGWDAQLDLSRGEGPIHVSAEAGIGDVRRSLVASCQDGSWLQEPRFLGRNTEAAALLSLAGTDGRGIRNIEIAEGPAGLRGVACESGDGVRGPDVLLSLVVPGAASEITTVDLALAGDCRLARHASADAKGTELVVSYQLCDATNAGDSTALTKCQIATLHYDGKDWHRMPSIDIPGSRGEHEQHAITLGSEGPLLAVQQKDGLQLFQAQKNAWHPLPSVPTDTCSRPIALQANPPRVIARSCAGRDTISAWLFADNEWRQAAPSMRLKPLGKAGLRAVASGQWLGETAYFAIGYQSAPVAMVYASAGGQWQKVLQAQVDPAPPKGPFR